MLLLPPPHPTADPLALLEKRRRSCVNYISQGTQLLTTATRTGLWWTLRTLQRHAKSRVRIMSLQLRVQIRREGWNSTKDGNLPQLDMEGRN